MSDARPLGVTRAALEAGGFSWIERTTFLTHLDEAGRDAALSIATFQPIDAGTRFVVEGRPSRWVFLLLSGEAKVERHGATGRPEPVGRLSPGHLSGERSVSTDTPASGTVTALSQLLCLAFEADAFRALLATSAELTSYVRDLIALRAKSSMVRELIARHPILRALDALDVDSFIQSGRLVRLQTDELLMELGDATTEVYLLLKGRVDVYGGGHRQHLGSQGPGYLFGHAAAVLDQGRTARIVSADATELLCVRAGALLDLMERNPMFRKRIMEDLARTDLSATAAVAARERGHLVAIYGARSHLGTSSIAFGLAAALGPVSLVDVQGASHAAALGAVVEDASHGDIATRRFWLGSSGDGLLGAADRIEVLWPARPDHLLPLLRHLKQTMPPRALTLCAAETETEAGADTMAMADSVVFVRGPRDAVHESATRRNQVRVDAVRMEAGVPIVSDLAAATVRFPADSAPVETFWRERSVAALASPSHRFGRACRRLGRKLIGRSIGLALGGGGALGFAHVGLIEALEARDLSVDLVAGSSFGALVAGLYAAGGTAALHTLVDRRLRLGVSAVSAFVSTKSFARFADDIVGDMEIGTTDIPFLPVSLDIETGGEFVLAHGTVGEGIRSSSGLPGVYPALEAGAMRLVDGGINNNVPASIVKKAGADFVLASNIIPTFPFKPGGRGVALRRAPILSRLDAGVRSLFHLMSQNGRDRSTQADYVFNLDLQGFNVYSFTSAKQILAAGRRQAEAQMEEILYAYRADGSRLYSDVG